MESLRSVNSGFLKKLWPSFGIYAAVVFILGAFLGGIALGRSQQDPAVAGTGKVINKNALPEYASKDVDMAQFWQVWETLKSNYLHKPVVDPKLFYGSIKGMVASLGDPYSSFFDPDEAASFKSQLEGSFEGIGAEIGFRDMQMTVISPLPGTPASKAGLKPGDAILKVNGEDTTNMALEIAVSKIRGPKGTDVTLYIYREGTKDPFDVKITRGKITIDSVKWAMVDDGGEEIDGNNGIALITISEFNQDTVKKFDSALRALLLRDAKGVIIDLRGNPGGYLDAAVEVSRAWVGNRPVVIQRKSNGSEESMSPSLKPMSMNLPTVVLVNKWSASASEIVAGAMQDYGKATIVGETTFGKGSVQEYLDSFPDGSALKLTVAEWLTPNKRSIEKMGIDPDVEVILTDEDIENGNDSQLDKAIELINAKGNTETTE